MKVYLGENVVLYGNITLSDQVGIFHNTVIRADTASVRIGRNTNIQDLVMIHAGEGHSVVLEENVTVGHKALLHGCTVKHDTIVGMGSILMNDVVVEDHCLIGAGSLLTQGKHFPAGSLIMGSPAKVIRSLTEEEKLNCEESARHYVEMSHTELHEHER